VVLLSQAFAGDIIMHPSGRYFQDAAGKPMFLLGYYNWAAVPDGSFIDHPSRYAEMIERGKTYRLNYIRISLGVNRFTDKTQPPSWDGQPTPTPFTYEDGKADLDRWDAVFWDGLRAQCTLARKNGVLVHISLFDGADIRGGREAYRYVNSFWNPKNQTRDFYPDPDGNGNGNIDEDGEFYQTDAFNGNREIGYYQRRLIDKALNETVTFDNVLYEIGNELLSSSTVWNTAVAGYLHTKTEKAVTQNGGDLGAKVNGWAQHSANTPAEVKARVAAIVGQGYPAWEDPDGPALCNVDVSPDDLRQAAWYSFTGGAAGWGGFTVDFWTGGPGFNKEKAAYYRNLRRFIRETGARFWMMTPRHDLVSDNGVNSCLANPGKEYIAYILRHDRAVLDLTAAEGKINYKIYNPCTGKWTNRRSVIGGASHTFDKPAGADDWVIYISR